MAEKRDWSKVLPCFYNHDGKCQKDGAATPIGDGQCAACADYRVESWRVDSHLGKIFPEHE